MTERGWAEPGGHFKPPGSLSKASWKTWKLEDTASPTSRMEGFQNQFQRPTFRENHFSGERLLFAFELELSGAFWPVCRKGLSGAFSTAAFHQLPVTRAAMTSFFCGLCTLEASRVPNRCLPS